MKNNCFFTGKLVADPKLFEGNPSRTCFTVCVFGDYRDKDGKAQASCFEFVAWRDTADYIARHFRKGDLVRIDDAKAKKRKYEDSNGVKHENVEFEVDGTFNIMRAIEVSDD